MLDQADSLHTIAELAIAVAGFAGIVVALDRRLSATEASFHGGLGILLGASFGAAFFAFVPEWVHATGAETDLVWRVSNALFGAYRLGYVGIVSRAARRADSPIPRPVVFASITLAFCHLAAAINLLPLHYLIYLTGLLWSLAMAGISFVRLVGMIPRNDRAA